MKKLLLFACILASCDLVFANVSLPKFFGNNMVLQRSKPINIWGWVDANEKVTVTFHNQTKTATANKDGKWKLQLNEEQAGGPFTLTVKGNNSISFSNILVGDVWICSGQSNMEMPIAGWGKINNYEEEIANANYPQIRHIKIPNTVSGQPQQDIPAAEWEVANPENAGDFTAAGYFFARELYKQLHVPIGLINTSWGGTHVETWTSREAFENSDEFKNMIAQMPSLNLDSLAALRKDEVKKKLQTIQGGLDENANTDTWKDAEINDSNWPQMQLPSLWESQQLDDLDGVVWFRKTINVTKEDAGKEAMLNLAKIDDKDVTYVNGTMVGSTDSYSAERSYTIPAGVLKAGKNVIAVRVEDTGGGGGIYGDSTNMNITINGNKILLAGSWLFKVASVNSNATSVGPNSYPTLLFNAMVNPLIPFTFKGVIWYQGEANAGRAYQYRTAFPLMITDWRKHWNEGNFPFYFVQLAAFNAGNGNSKNGSNWAELREAQSMTLSLPNTGMAVTTDIGNETDIHPKNKQDVGKRLAAIALNKTYGKDVVYSGPTYQSMKVDGNKITLTFTNTGSGLMAKDGELKGFEIAGRNQKFHSAKATIQGNNVVIFSDSVDAPVAVRFAWADYPGDANLFNKEGFPAVPFRTDKWKGITEASKFVIGQ